MQVMKIYTWLDAADALKVIELLDALREALIEEHAEHIEAMLRDSGQLAETRTDSQQQGELPF